ncbi:AraC family transcriptional regulator [Spirosoma jeollabukense]
MKLERFLPTEQLRPYVKAFIVIDSEQGMINRILPDTSIVLAFRYKGIVSYGDGQDKTYLPVSVVTGLRSSLRLIDYARETATLLVVFTEGGAAAFFNESLHELFGVSVSLDEFIQRRFVSELEEQLAEATDNQQRIKLVDRFLLARLNEQQNDKLIAKAIQQIQLANGAIRINDLITAFSISRDPFEKRFRRAVGTSPKQFSTIVRLRTLIHQHSPTQRLTETAYKAGYFDQAHFIKDFKMFTGEVPHLFFKGGPYW